MMRPVVGWATFWVSLSDDNRAETTALTESVVDGLSSETDAPLEGPDPDCIRLWSRLLPDCDMDRSSVHIELFLARRSLPTGDGTIAVPSFVRLFPVITEGDGALSSAAAAFSSNGSQSMMPLRTRECLRRGRSDTVVFSFSGVGEGDACSYSLLILCCCRLTSCILRLICSASLPSSIAALRLSLASTVLLREEYRLWRSDRAFRAAGERLCRRDDSRLGIFTGECAPVPLPGDLSPGDTARLLRRLMDRSGWRSPLLWGPP